MSDDEQDRISEKPNQGFNLTLAYGLIAVALLAAICIALFIVFPFYSRRH